jgi:hypothetical protein
MGMYWRTKKTATDKLAARIRAYGDHREALGFSERARQKAMDRTLAASPNTKRSADPKG